MGGKVNPTFNKIIVSCNQSQKDYIKIGGIEVKMANNYEKNYREKSPVLCTVVDGNEKVNKGDVLICHHNLFFQPSPYYLYDDLFSIPFSSVVFAKLQPDNSLLPICGNVLVDRIKKDTLFPLPPELQKTYDTKYRVIHSGYTNYKKGTIIHTRPFSGYDIIHTVNGVRNVSIKVDTAMICGFVK